MRERSDHSFAKQIPIGRQKTVSYCVFRLTNHVSFYNVRHENNKAVKMVLESTMVCVDTSEYMRNGDFIPTRFQAQQDAVNLVCHSKTRSNPENTVGLLTLANVKVLATLTTDVGKLLGSLHQIQPKGDISFSTAVKVAHVSLYFHISASYIYGYSTNNFIPKRNHKLEETCCTVLIRVRAHAWANAHPPLLTQ
ncbi:putative PIP5K1A and PSMD4-like protein [Saccoglossus kowalevskii]